MKPTAPKYLSWLKSSSCRSSFFVACLGVSALFLPAAAQAATLAVPAQYATIQAGVNAAQNGDTVLVADGTYAGPGNVDIDFNGKNITVTSQHGAASTIIDCQGSSSANHRGFILQNGETNISISGLTVKNAYESSYDGGGIYLNTNGKVKVTDCIFVSNTAYEGGGICNQTSAGPLTVSHCQFVSNTGGGMLNLNQGTGTVIVADCTFSGNSGPDGAGIDNDNSGGGTITVAHCTFNGNNANIGGGIYNLNLNNSTGTITISSCSLNNNTAGLGGGVYNLSYGAPIVVTNCALTGNMAITGSGLGGGMFNGNQNFGILSITNCSLSGNTATKGGGLYNIDIASTSGNTITLTNDILYGDNGDEVTDSAGSTLSATATHCDIQGGYPGTDNIDADPLFVSATDFHLQTGSPCLGAGTASGAPTTDITGASRPNPPSIGAYDAGLIAYTLWNSADGQVQVRGVNPDGTQTTLGTFGPYTDSGDQGVPGNAALWKAIAVARVPDGTLRLLWQHPDGRVMLWRLDASGTPLSITGYGPYDDTGDQGVPGNTGVWHAVGLTVSADGLTHLLWDHPDGRAMLWNVNSDDTFSVIGGYGPYTDSGDVGIPGNTAAWHVTTLASAPDGSLRLLWNHPDGRVMLWNVSGAGTPVSLGGYGPYTDSTDAGVPGNTALWKAVAVRVSADGDAHLLWDHPDGRAMVWDVDGSYNIAGLTGYGPYTDAPISGSLWQAVGLALTSYGLPYVLWSNPDGRTVLWNIAGDGTVNYSGIFEATSDSASQAWVPTAVSGN